MKYYANLLAALTLFLLLNTAKAENMICKPSKNYPHEDATVTMSGVISAGDDIPVGTVLYKASYKASSPAGISCQTETGNYRGQIIVPVTTEYNNMPNQEVPGMKGVYQTNLSGIGVSFSLRPFDAQMYIYPDNKVDGKISIAEGFKLIKTGPISPGVVNAMSFPDVKTTALEVNAPGYTMTGLPMRLNALKIQGQLSVINSTCNIEVKDIYVHLGKFDTEMFREIGSTSEWRDATIRLSGCSTFKHGYFSGNNETINIEGSGQLSAGTPDVTNRISLRINTTQGSETWGSDTFSIDYSSADAASGIGIQLGLESGAGIVNPLRALLSPLNLAELPDTGSNSLTLPIRARYIRGPDRLKPGVANAKVIYIINYY